MADRSTGCAYACASFRLVTISLRPVVTEVVRCKSPCLPLTSADVGVPGTSNISIFSSPKTISANRRVSFDSSSRKPTLSDSTVRLWMWANWESMVPEFAGEARRTETKNQAKVVAKRYKAQ